MIYVINFIPLLSGLCILGFGLFIFFRKYPFNLRATFLGLCLTAFIWFLGTFLMFINRDNESVAIFWDRFVYLGVVFSPVVFYHFSLVFCRLSERKVLIVIGYILAFIFLILSRTEYFISGLFKYQWIVHTQAQSAHDFFMVFLLLYMSLTLVNFYQKYRTSFGPFKTQALYMFIAFFLFIVISVTAFLPAYGIDIYPLAYISGMVFSVLLTYLLFVRMAKKP